MGILKQHFVGKTNVLLKVFEFGPDPQPITPSFLYSCFQDFPRECSISNANAQLWPENGTNLSRQISR